MSADVETVSDAVTQNVTLCALGVINCDEPEKVIFDESEMVTCDAPEMGIVL